MRISLFSSSRGDWVWSGSTTLEVGIARGTGQPLTMLPGLQTDTHYDEVLRRGMRTRESDQVENRGK